LLINIGYDDHNDGPKNDEDQTRDVYNVVCGMLRILDFS
jgi:hypothetical protein